MSPTVLPASTGFCRKCFYFLPSGLLVCMMHSAVGVVFSYFFFPPNKDLLSLCLIRPLQAGCTDPVPQTELVSWIQQGCKPLRPPLSQLLCRAVPLHRVTEQAVHGGTSCAKRTASLIAFQCHCTLITTRWGGGGGRASSHHTNKTTTKLHSPNAPHIKAGHKHRDSFMAGSTHMNGKYKTAISEMPSRHRDQEERSEELSSPGALRDCKEECKLSW